MHFIIFHSLVSIPTVHFSVKYGILSQIAQHAHSPLEDEQLSDTSQNPAADSIWSFWVSPAIQIHGGTDSCSSFTLCTPQQQKVVILGLSGSCVS